MSYLQKNHGKKYRSLTACSVRSKSYLRPCHKGYCWCWIQYHGKEFKNCLDTILKIINTISWTDYIAHHYHI